MYDVLKTVFTDCNALTSETFRLHPGKIYHIYLFLFSVSSSTFKVIITEK